MENEIGKVAGLEQGMRVQEISPSVYLTEEYIRALIRRHNKEGAELFDIHRSPGQPVQFTKVINQIEDFQLVLL